MHLSVEPDSEEMDAGLEDEHEEFSGEDDDDDEEAEEESALDVAVSGDEDAGIALVEAEVAGPVKLDDDNARRLSLIRV